jgi:hypothetical protein
MTLSFLIMLFIAWKKNPNQIKIWSIKPAPFYEKNDLYGYDTRYINYEETNIERLIYMIRIKNIISTLENTRYTDEYKVSFINTLYFIKSPDITQNIYDNTDFEAIDFL